MMNFFQECIVSGVFFGNHLIGIVTKPYETYRRIVEKGRVGELFYIGICCLLYFALASLVRVFEFRPFLLTKEFVLLGSGSLLGWIGSVVCLYVLGRITGGKGSFLSVSKGWGYTMIPTVLWFLTTSILYIILPPPRTDAWTGILFSFLYLIFSGVLFFWKAELYYLTLRFSLKLRLSQIIMVTGGFLLWGVLFSFGVYRLGIFRVPFL